MNNLKRGAIVAQRISHKSRKPSDNNSHHAAEAKRHSREFDETSESDDMDDEAGYLAEGAAHMRELARGREMQAVVTALAAGFSIGVVLGGVIAGSRRREVVDENLVRRMLSGMQKMVPETVSRHLKP
jgi:hypothetical protein